RQEGSRRAASKEHKREQRPGKQGPAQHPAANALARRARGELFDQLASDIGQSSVAHAGGADRFAGPAGEAAVEMQLRLGADGGALKHLLDKVDAPARTVEFVAEQLVGWTGRGAEAAMHAGAQNRLGFAALRGVPDESGEMGFQG